LAGREARSLRGLTKKGESAAFAALRDASVAVAVPSAHMRAMEAPMMRILLRASVLVFFAIVLSAPASAEGPDLIFKKSTVFKFLTPNDKLAVYGIDDPAVEGVACHYTLPEKGGLKGMIGVAEEVSDISLACRQVGPIRFKEKFEQGDVVVSERRSLVFKKMQIVRGCDVKRNTLVYLVYSDRLIEGSPKNSTSSVPIAPWGGSEAPRCGDWVRG
jgi:CreA protein